MEEAVSIWHGTPGWVSQVRLLHRALKTFREGEMNESILILEDEHSKLLMIFTKYREVLEGKTIVICRSAAAAMTWCEANPDHRLKVFLDYELAPAMGNGVDLLVWLIHNRKAFVEMVHITTFYPSMRMQLSTMCDANSIPWEVQS